jgi:hypothetical protein
MPTTRRPIARCPIPQITDEVLNLFRRACEIEHALGGIRNATLGLNPKDAPRRAEYQRISMQLHRALQLEVWDENILFVSDEGVPSWMSAERASGYLKVQRIRRMLRNALEAAEQPNPSVSEVERPQPSETTRAVTQGTSEWLVPHDRGSG